MLPSGSGSGEGEMFGKPSTIQIMPTKTLIKGYATGTAAADAVINTIVPTSGRLVACIGVARGVVAAAATEHARFEISLQSSSQFTVNDAGNVIGYVEVNAPSATIGQCTTVHFDIVGMDIKVDAGSRLYVHRTTGTPLGTAMFQISWVIA